MCFYHPEDKNRCVKVAMRPTGVSQLQRELNAAQICSAHLKRYIPNYDNKLVDTNLGPGLVCEIIRDDDGTPSLPIGYYIDKNMITQDITAQMNAFYNILMEHSIPIYDFNVKNFLIQIKNGKPILRFTDLKSYNSYKPFTYLRLERCIPGLARCIIRRRLSRLMRSLSLHQQ